MRRTSRLEVSAMIPDGVRRFVPHLPVVHHDPVKSAKPKTHSKPKAHARAHAKPETDKPDKQQKHVARSFSGVDGRSTFAHGEFEKNAAWKKFSGEAGNARHGASGQLNVLHAGASGKGEAYADFAHGRVGVDGSASARANLVDAKGEAHLKYGPGSTTVDGEGFVGAEANAKGEAAFDPRKGTVDAGVDASAFAGARAKASVTEKVGPVGATAGAEGWAGVGAEAKADLGLEHGKLQAKFSVGAALGLGGELSFGVSVDPAGAAKGAAHLASGAAHGLGSGAKSVAHFFGF